MSSSFKLPFIFLSLLIAIIIPSPILVDATTYLHRATSSVGAASTSSSFLRGRVIAPTSNIVKSATGKLSVQETSESAVIDFRAKLQNDVILWEELVQDNVKITRCTLNPETRKASITLRGDTLDKEDFQKGIVFPIGVDAWEKNCGALSGIAGIDDTDDYLFYKIEAVSFGIESGSGTKLVKMGMILVPGEEVVPEVDFEIDENPEAVAAMPKNILFDNDPLFQASVRYVTRTASNMTDDKTFLRTTSRPSVSISKTVNIFKGATVKAQASVSAKLRKFKLRRLRGVKVEWEQNLVASASATLEMKAKVSGSRSGDIIRKAIPKIGVSVKIPFVGRVRAGAFGILQWIIEAEVNGGVTASVNARYESRQRVRAQLSPPDFSTTNLPVSNDGKKSSSSLDFDTAADPKFIGFAGLRPALGTTFSLGKRGVEMNVGASVGVRATTQFKKPPFTPFSGSGGKVGQCDRCHFLRGQLSVRGQNLSAQLVKNGKVRKEKVIVKKLFDIPIGTICALEAKCENPDSSSPGSGTPKPPTKPTKPPTRPPTRPRPFPFKPRPRPIPSLGNARPLQPPVILTARN